MPLQRTAKGRRCELGGSRSARLHGAGQRQLGLAGRVEDVGQSRQARAGFHVAAQRAFATHGQAAGRGGNSSRQTLLGVSHRLSTFVNGRRPAPDAGGVGQESEGLTRSQLRGLPRGVWRHSRGRQNCRRLVHAARSKGAVAISVGEGQAREVRFHEHSIGVGSREDVSVVSSRQRDRREDRHA